MTDTSVDDRERWLVDTHLRGIYNAVRLTIGPHFSDNEALTPHLFDAMVGAGSVLLAVRDEVAELTRRQHGRRDRGPC